MGLLEVLIPLTNSSSLEVQGNAAAAIGNLSSKGNHDFGNSVSLAQVTLAADDYSAFVSVWNEPEGGLEGYIVRFLKSEDTTFQHIAIWTVLQLLESGSGSFSIFVVRDGRN
jgi:hypothetical protein